MIHCKIAKCKNKILFDNRCCRHLKQKCTICLDANEITSINTIQTKRLSCGHSFHTNCIIEWFTTSDECPICRCKQPEDDQFLKFKNQVEDNIRLKYKDAITSFETEINRLNQTLHMQAMFSLPPPAELSLLEQLMNIAAAHT